MIIGILLLLYTIVSLVTLPPTNGKRKSSRPLVGSNQEFETDIDYSDDDDHLLMHIAEMLHVVYLFRRKDMTAIDKIENFLIWNYDNLLICNATLVYMLLLFTGQEGIMAPKHSMSTDFNKIVVGCRNQAWDLNYISNWSCFYYNEPTINNETFLFATNDVLLKKIVINIDSENGIDTLACSILSNKEYERVQKVFLQKAGNNRSKPNFGSEPKRYFHNLIHNEEELVKSLL